MGILNHLLPSSSASGNRPPLKLTCKLACSNLGVPRLASLSSRMAANSAATTREFTCLLSCRWSATDEKHDFSRESG